MSSEYGDTVKIKLMASEYGDTMLKENDDCFQL